MKNKTIEWYSNHAEEYFEQTVYAEKVKYAAKRFMENVPKGSLILDLGCGSGRDAKFFIENGYQVEAIDGSDEMCEIASKYTGIQVQQMDFRDFKEKEKYEGIWACASLLHITSEELHSVFSNLMNALKMEGFLYMSFKLGNFEGERDGRHYTDMNIEKSAELILPHKDALLMECWKSHDARPEVIWLNLIFRKIHAEENK